MLIFPSLYNPPSGGGGGLSIISSGILINTSSVGTTPTILTSVTMTAGDMLVLMMGFCRNTGSSAMSASGTWNSEAFTAETSVLHSGGRMAGQILHLVAASSGTFSPAITLSNSAAAVGCEFYVVRGQGGSPVAQIRSGIQNATPGGAVTVTALAPTNPSIIFACASGKFTTGGITSMTPDSPLTSDANFVTGSGNNLDLGFGAGHLANTGTSDTPLTFTPNVNCNIVANLIEVI